MKTTAAQGGEARFRALIGQDDAEKLRLVLVALAAGGEGGVRALQVGARKIGAHRLFEDGVGGERGRLELAAQLFDRGVDTAGAGDVALDCGAARKKRADGLEALAAAGLGGKAGRLDQRLVAAHDAAAHGAEGGVPQVGGVIVVEFGEAGRDAGLQWESAEDAAGKGVDGLDAQAAGRFERLREQLAREADIFVRVVANWSAFELRQFDLELSFLHHAPVAEACEQAGLHLAGGRLGVGDAQDGVGLGALEQQAGDAVDQDFRLA